MKVYVVTSGEYSDYGIESVFDSKEKAEVYCAIHNDNDWENYRIEEYELFDIEYKDVKVWQKNKVWFCANHKGEYYIHTFDTLYTTKRKLDSFETGNYNVAEVTFIFYTQGKTEEEIKKIAYDKLAWWKAEGEEEC